MNLRVALESTVKTKKVASFDFGGHEFPTRVTKRFLSTFKKSDEVFVTLVEEEIRFVWKNGYAHINSVAKAKSLMKGKK